MASLAAAKKAGSKIPADLLKKFDELCAKDTDAQAELFLTSFIFVLGDDWKKVVELSKTFKDYLGDLGESHDLNPVQASDFLQKQGRTRTGLERKQELTDIDLNFDGRICFAEYCLLHCGSWHGVVLAAVAGGRGERSVLYRSGGASSRTFPI